MITAPTRRVIWLNELTRFFIGRLLNALRQSVSYGARGLDAVGPTNWGRPQRPPPYTSLERSLNERTTEPAIDLVVFWCIFDANVADPCGPLTKRLNINTFRAAGPLLNLGLAS